MNKNHLIQCIMILIISFSASIANSYSVGDTCPDGGTLQFWWTEDGVIIPETYQSITTPGSYVFGPAPSNATDWGQIVTNADGTSYVYSGNFQQESPGSSWDGVPLDELPLILWTIPDFIPISSPYDTIYTFVNLFDYMSANPDPGIGIGDEMLITSGLITGLDGIIFSTTEVYFDPDSQYGYAGFTPYTGTAEVIAYHGSVPIPSTLLFIGVGFVYLLSTRRKFEA